MKHEKKWAAALSSALLAGVLLTACGGAASEPPPSPPSVSVPPESESAGSQTPESTPEENAVNETIYRGEVTELTEDSMTVKQPAGQNYGQESIVFHFSDETKLEENGPALSLGAFVEVKYNGAPTRSLPAQGTADEVTVISAVAEGVVVDGVIHSAEQTDDGWKLVVLPLGADVAGMDEAAAFAAEGTVVLNVPTEALEGIDAGALVPGAEISAVTKGIATMSIPPQMPVHALLPYTPAEA